MVESVIEVYPTQVGRVNNLSSGVFSATSGLGEVIGPLFGAAMMETSGFRMTSDLTAMVTLFYVFIFIFVITNGMDSIKKIATKNGAGESLEGQETEEETKDEGELTADAKKGRKLKLPAKQKKSVADDDAVSFSSESLLSH